MEQMLTVKDVAVVLQVCEETVYRWIKKGNIKATKISNDWRIHPKSLEKLFE